MIRRVVIEWPDNTAYILVSHWPGPASKVRTPAFLRFCKTSSFTYAARNWDLNEEIHEFSIRGSQTTITMQSGLAISITSGTAEFLDHLDRPTPEDEALFFDGKSGRAKFGINSSVFLPSGQSAAVISIVNISVEPIYLVETGIEGMDQLVFECDLKPIPERTSPNSM